MSIRQRKKDHVTLTTTGQVDYLKGTGFEDLKFRHNALPEVNFEDTSTEIYFLSHSFSFPLFISSMTGGYTDAGAVNAIIARFCEDYNLPFGVGSQRIMLEDHEAVKSFSVVREHAPNAFIAANIGGAQLIGGMSREHSKLLVHSIEADAVIVHLNPLQELMQPEGDHSFKGIDSGIVQLVEAVNKPVIVKETGAGINGMIAARLLEIGISVIDVAGAGGTSWAKVENERKKSGQKREMFNDWGTPTVQCVRELDDLKNDYDFEFIASGGIRSSLHIAKSLCLGADFAAAAQPIIKAVVDEGYEGLEKVYQEWKHQLKIILVLLGCEKPSDLDKRHLYLE